MIILRGFTAILMICHISMATGIGSSARAGELPTGPPVEVIQGPPPGYEVVRLTAPNDLAIHSRPDINDRSDVIWSASFPPDVSNIRIFRDGRFYQVTDDEAYEVNPTLSNSGDFVFIRSLFAGDAGDIVFLQGTQEIVLDANEGDCTPVVGNNSRVVFSDDFSGNFTHVELFFYDGRSTNQITSNGLSNAVVRINSDGVLVWVRYDFLTSPWTSTIMHRTPDGEITELTDESTQTQSPDINDCEQIVWCDSQPGVHLWDDGRVIQLTDQDERAPRINNSGELMYIRWDEQAELWRIIVRFGDAEYVLSSDIYTFGAGAINNRGEITWRGLHDTLGWTSLYMMRKISPKGDANGDCKIDFLDYAMMQHCFTGSSNGPTGGFLADCTHADFDEDGDVDMADLISFNTAFIGPDALVPDCLP